MRIFGTARFGVKPEALDRCRSAIEEFVTYVHSNEPGTKLYLSLQATEEPARFLHVMIFDDEAAENIHTNSEAVKLFTDALYPETVDGVTFEKYTRQSARPESDPAKTRQLPFSAGRTSLPNSSTARAAGSSSIPG